MLFCVKIIVIDLKNENILVRNGIFSINVANIIQRKGTELCIERF